MIPDVFDYTDVVFLLLAVVLAFTRKRTEVYILLVMMAIDLQVSYWLFGADFYIIGPEIKGSFVYPLVFQFELVLAASLTYAVRGCYQAIFGYALCIGVVTLNAFASWVGSEIPQPAYAALMSASYIFLLWGAGFGNGYHPGRRSLSGYRNHANKVGNAEA